MDISILRSHCIRYAIITNGSSSSIEDILKSTNLILNYFVRNAKLVSKSCKKSEQEALEESFQIHESFDLAIRMRKEDSSTEDIIKIAQSFLEYMLSGDEEILLALEK